MSGQQATSVNNVGASCRYRSCQLLSIKVKKKYYKYNTSKYNTARYPDNHPEKASKPQAQFRDPVQCLKDGYQLQLPELALSLKGLKRVSFKITLYVPMKRQRPKLFLYQAVTMFFFSSSSSVTLNIILSILTSGIEFWSFSWTLRELLFLVLLQCAHN